MPASNHRQRIYITRLRWLAIIWRCYFCWGMLRNKDALHNHIFIKELNMVWHPFSNIIWLKITLGILVIQNIIWSKCDQNTQSALHESSTLNIEQEYANKHLLVTYKNQACYIINSNIYWKHIQSYQMRINKISW